MPRPTKRRPRLRRRRPLVEALEPRQLLAPLTPGNLLVFRMGEENAAPIGNVATAVFLDEVSPTGALVQTLAVPTADNGPNQILTTSPNGLGEGLMSRSDDGQFVFFAGYDAPPGTSGLTGSASSTIRRVIARVDAAGSIDTTTTIGDGFSASTVRSAFSPDGTNIWVSGSTGGASSGGIRYTTFGSTGPSTQLSSTNTRSVAVAGGQLYMAAQTGTLRLGAVGTGTPTTPGQSITALPGILTGLNAPGNDPNQFFFADLSQAVPGVDTVYIADTNRGLCKFSLVGGTWVFNSNLLWPQGAGQPGLRALTGRVADGSVTIYAITDTVQDNNALAVCIDTSGYNAGLSGPLAPTGYSAGSRRVARGVTFVPEFVVPPLDPDPLVTGTSGDDELLLRRAGDRLVLTLAAATLLDQPLAETLSLTIDALSGNDRLTIDYAAGNPLPAGGLAYHGGLSGGDPGDRLAIIGTLAQTAAYRPSPIPGGPSGGHGLLAIDALPVAFTGLESLDLIDLDRADVIPTGGDDDLTLAGGLTSRGAAALVVDGTSSGVPLVALRGIAHLALDTTASDGADTITLAGSQVPHGNANLRLATGSGDDLVQITGATSFTGLVEVSTGRIEFPLDASLLSAGGPISLRASGHILDASPRLTSIVAPSLGATAGTGLVLGTSVGTLAAVNSSTTSGDIRVHNNGGLLMVGQAGSIRGIVNHNAATAGQIELTNAGPITVTAAVASPGNIILVAGETAADGIDHLAVVGPEGDVHSLLGSVRLSAGDDVTLALGTSVSAATSAHFDVDEGNLDPSGGALTILGTVSSGWGALVSGGTDRDSFHLPPQSTSSFQIDGEDPAGVPIGDDLFLDTTGTTSATLVLAGAGAGAWSFGNRQVVSYQSIEQIHVTPAAVPEDLILDMRLAGFQDGLADEIFVRLDSTGVQLLIAVNGLPVFSGARASVASLTVVGSDDADRVRIDEVNGRLPRFAGQTPAVNNLAAGGGVANPSHLGPSANLLLESLFFAGSAWDATDVSIHFAGGAGDDSIGLNLAAGRIVSHTSDALGPAGSGNLLAAAALGPDFLLSYSDTYSLELTGPGSVLVVDATGTPDTAAIWISDDAQAGDGWSQVAADEGLATTRFREFSQLLVFGGDGGETIEQVGFDSASNLSSVLLAGGNMSDFLGRPGGDLGPDTIRVRGTLAATPVTVRGHGGDDLVQLFGADHSLDQFLASVTITGDAGDNTLVIDDRGSLVADMAFITEKSIDGLTIGGSIHFQNIDSLDLTASQGDDTLDAHFAPGSDLDSVTLSGWAGSDRLLASTSDEQVGGAATGIQAIRLFGDAPGNPNQGDGSDTFGQPLGDLPGTPVAWAARPIRPSASTRIEIDGGLPAEGAAGDVLNLDVSALGPPIVLPTAPAAAGQAVVVQSQGAAPVHRPVTYTQIEAIHLADGGRQMSVAMGDLYVRGSDGADFIMFLATLDRQAGQLRMGALQGNVSVPGRVVVDARGGNDYVLLGNFDRAAEIYGGAGDDYLTGYLAGDKIAGGPGRDRIDAGAGDNVVWGDDDPVAAGLSDTLANRQLMSAAGPGPLAEAFYADIVNAGSGRDTVYGGPGADQITTGGGDDWASGGQGNDTIGTAAGDDRLFGNEGSDHLAGGEGHDVLVGGAGSDVLTALTGQDVLIGGAGDDTLYGDAGRDLLVAGRAEYEGSAADSQAAGDAADLALAALLADWLANFAVAGLVASDDAAGDKLRGGLHEADEFWTESDAEILDLEPALDRRKGF